jgi:hypothetical protein
MSPDTKDVDARDVLIDRPAPIHRRPWVKACVAILLYLIGSIVIWGLPVMGHLGSRYVSQQPWDANFFRWALAWTPWALLHGHDPLWTGVVFAPEGATLTWTTLTPAAGIVAWPLTALWGTLVAYNVILLLAPALAGWAAYLVCHRLTRRFWPSLVGGAVFAYSTYVTGQLAAGHLNLVLIFPVPLAVYLVIRRIEGSLGTTTFVTLFAGNMLTLFLISTEIFATSVLFGTLALGLAWLAAGPHREALARTSLVIGGALAIVLVIVLVPYVVPAMKGAPEGSFRDPGRTAATLVAWIMPRQDMFVGGSMFARYSGDTNLTGSVPWEDGSYMDVALAAVLLGFAVTERRRRETLALIAFIVAVVVLSLGPLLHVARASAGTMPTSFLWRVPLIRNAEPRRFPLYAALALGVVAALWLARRQRSAVRWGLVLLGIVLLLPRAPSPPWHPNDRVPSFFADGTFREVLGEGEEVFVIPGHAGEEMLWQSVADFSFKMPQGYIGALPRDHSGRFDRGLAVVTWNPTIPDPGSLRAWLSARGVTAVVLGDLARAKFETTLIGSGLRPAYQGGGVSVWRWP